MNLAFFIVVQYTGLIEQLPSSSYWRSSLSCLYNWFDWSIACIIDFVDRLWIFSPRRVALTNNSLEWVQDFGNKGLKQVLSVLNECFRK